MRIKTGLIGSAGYTGGELLRLLLRHPKVELRSAVSSSSAGKALHEVHDDLVGETDLRFSSVPESGLDALFLCLPHGKARAALVQFEPSPNTAIIDLSRDHRPGPNNSKDFVYGLPEVYREFIRGKTPEAKRIANPGCFATAISLGLLPLAAGRRLRGDIHTSAITGSTGAGAQLRETGHFSWRSGNAQVYKAFRHEHLPEIHNTLYQLQPGFAGTLHFVPYRGAFTRGIIATSYTECDLSESEAVKLYTGFYAKHPFVHVVTKPPHIKQVLHTNKCLVYCEKHDGMLMLVSVIDNLLKGASGQALQNFNLLFGFPEETGLNLKAGAY